ncbi:ECF-type sigma factor [Aquimonas sp.]|jgi:RNA polymerase sigma factor (TIGR02999 family)|uniref:ECF-type sigma factor n=1 Tax=Aquimonas sp. TaxID=1872588 RepID=UPI0037C17CC8
MSQVDGVALPAAALFDQLYAELKRIAHRQLAAGGATLQTTGLVHEAYLKLANAQVLDEAHLLNLASRAMRQVLVDMARCRASDKRGGGLRLVTLTSGGVVADETDPLDVLALEQCLTRLAEASPRLAQVVELHFFGGLSFPEMSRVLQVAERTLFRDWRTARAMIYADLGAAAANESDVDAGPQA